MRISHFASDAIKRMAECFFLARAIARLKASQEFQGDKNRLLGCHWRRIAENRAISNSGRHIGSLEYALKLREFAAWRALRARGLSECYIAALVEYAALHWRQCRRTPLHFLSTQEAGFFHKAETALREIARLETVENLKRQRAEIDRQLAELAEEVKAA